MENNTEKLKETFAESLGIEIQDVSDKLVYQGITEWDSISHMILISSLEDAFDVSIETTDVIDLSSFQKAKEILIKYNVKF